MAKLSPVSPDCGVRLTPDGFFKSATEHNPCPLRSFVLSERRGKEARSVVSVEIKAETHGVLVWLPARSN